MERKGFSIRALSEKLKTTYEHVRSIVRGNVVPSRYILRELAEVLDINLKELERVTTADKIRVKFGKIPLELSGKNPELEPLERAWPYL